MIGRGISLDGRPATIAAVLPVTFHPQLQSSGVIVDLDTAEPAAYRMRRVDPPPRAITPATGVRIYQAIGELKAGITIAQARAEIDAIHTRDQRDHPTPFGTTSVVVMPLQDKIVGPSRRALGILLAASFIVLLITCANVANLLLSRAGARRKEIALRMTVGSGPLRIVRQLLAESLAYAVLGGIGGVLLSLWLVNTVIAVIGAGVPRLSETQLDFGVLAVAAALSIGTALLFGIGPALALGRDECAGSVEGRGSHAVSVTSRADHWPYDGRRASGAHDRAAGRGGPDAQEHVADDQVSGRLRAGSDPDDAHGHSRSAVPRPAGPP